MIDFAGVLSRHLHLAVGHVETNRVKDFRVPLIQHNQDIGRRDVFQIVNYFGAHFRERGEIFDGAGFHVDSEQVKIFVTFGVLGVNDELVTLPKIILNIPILFRGNSFRIPAGSGTGPNVHTRLPGAQVREGLAVSGE